MLAKNYCFQLNLVDLIYSINRYNYYYKNIPLKMCGKK